jgi:hypothetical protein
LHTRDVPASRHEGATDEIADMVRPGGAIGVQKTNRRDKKTKQKLINGFCVA